MGFDENMQQVTQERLQENKNKDWAHISTNSKKLITFLDLCGHEKYLKTTMFGLVGLMPDYAAIIVGANMGVSRMTWEHLRIAQALKIPIFIVVTKVDISPPEKYQDTITVIEKILKSRHVLKMPV